MSDTLERVQKIIAQSGLTSRRKAEELIIAGRVQVNQETITELGTKVSPKDEVSVDGVPLDKEKLVYYLLYKPRGVISSLSDDKDREVVTDLMPTIEERIFPIGRLDYNTSGALLLTNDGEFANLLMHPRYEIEKTYVACLEGIPTTKQLEQLKTGVYDEGDHLTAVNYRVLSVDKKKNVMILEIKLKEGKNRHIHRMMEGIGFPVAKLKREKYSFITLKGLQPGQYRKLTFNEVKELKDLAEQNLE